jgi:DHA1 family multidrug resistance protein-like MFS transporter
VHSTGRLRLAVEGSTNHIGYRSLAGLPIAIWSMLLNAFSMSFGFFMLIPLVSVYYTTSLGFTAAMVGLALAVRQFTQQGLMLVTGNLAERVGYRPVLAAGMVIRSGGFLTFVFADTLPLLLLASLIAALGGGFFEVSARATMATIVPAEQRTDAFSLWSLASNVGMAIGPLVGAMLIGFSFSMVCLAAAAIYLVSATGTMLLIPPAQRSGEISRPPGILRTIGWVIHDRTFVVFSAIMTGYYLMGTQLFITVPLESERLTGSTDSLGAIFLVNSVVAVALQFPLVRLATRHLTALQAVAAGTGCLALSLASISLANGFVMLLLSVACISASRVIIEPVVNSSVARIASRAGEGLLASYFGFSALSLAIGGAAGQLLGGWLFDQSEARGVAALPWLILGAIGLAVTVALVIFSLTPAARNLINEPATNESTP